MNFSGANFYVIHSILVELFNQHKELGVPLNVSDYCKKRKGMRCKMFRKSSP
jgi:hypothetical protein